VGESNSQVPNSSTNSPEPEKAPVIIRVVLVEDHLLTRVGLKTVIERTPDIRVVGEADNGQEAIAKVAALHPDVVLMDVGMPVMDGIEAAAKIRAEHPEINIIMLTSHDNDRDIFASLSAGAGGYCLKDVDPQRLYTAIRSVKAGDIWLDSAIANRVFRYYGTSGMSKDSLVKGPEAHGLAVSEHEHGNHSHGQSHEVTSSPAPQMGHGRPAITTPLPEPLSPRELEVLNLLVDGLSNQEIADRLIISLATAKTHVRNILNKLAVDDRTQAAVQAMRRGIV
jgi:DNA-binding NarL/FixJ family response regulator